MLKRKQFCEAVRHQQKNANPEADAHGAMKEVMLGPNSVEDRTIN